MPIIQGNLVIEARYVLGSVVLVTALMMISSWAVLGEAQLARSLPRQRDAASPVPRLCVRELAKQLPADALVLTRGGAALDPHGHAVAYNEWPPFVWAERFGARCSPDRRHALVSLSAAAQDRVAH